MSREFLPNRVFKRRVRWDPWLFSFMKCAFVTKQAYAFCTVLLSLPARGAWIEILPVRLFRIHIQVAPRKGSVERRPAERSPAGSSVTAPPVSASAPRPSARLVRSGPAIPALLPPRRSTRRCRSSPAASGPSNGYMPCHTPAGPASGWPCASFRWAPTFRQVRTVSLGAMLLQ